MTTPWPTDGYPVVAGGQVAGRAANTDSGLSIQAAVAEVSDELAGQLPDGPPGPDVMPRIAAAVRRWAQRRHTAGGPVIPPHMQDMIADAVRHQHYGLGLLDSYLSDELGTVENVDLIGYDQVWVTYATGERVRAQPVFASDTDLIEAVRALAARGGSTARDFTEHHPLVNVSIGRRIRLTATMDVTPRPCVSLRRHGYTSIHLARLVELGTLTQALADFLAAAVKARFNIIVTGGANAGKTTLLRALASQIPAWEQIATLETDRELFLEDLPDHPIVIAFEQRRPNSEGTGGITLMDLLPQALRHHTTRILVGEARTDETVPMIEAMNSGWAGSMCTMHANSAEAAFDRILILALRGGLAMAERAIHLMVGNSVDLIVHIRQHHDGHKTVRRVSEVLEVSPPGDSERPSIARIFAADGPGGHAVPRHGPSTGLLERLEAAGFGSQHLGTCLPLAPGVWP